MKQLFAVLVVLPAVALANYVVDPEITQFLSFETKFNKVYGSEEERIYRFEVFQQNLAEISRHNSRQGVTYTKGINQFSDLTGK